MKYLPLLLGLLLVGCATQQPLMISSTSMGPGQEQVVGMATGSGHKYFFPILGAVAPLGIGDDSLKAAMEDALTHTKAHSLINVFADRQCMFFPHPMFYLVARCETRLVGTAIRYTNLAANSYWEAIGLPQPTTPKQPLRSKTADLIRFLVDGQQKKQVKIVTTSEKVIDGTIVSFEESSGLVWVKPDDGGKNIYVYLNDIKEIK